MDRLEQEVIKQISLTVAGSIQKVLTGYSSPLIPLVNRAVAEREAEINALIGSYVDKALLNLAESSEIEIAIRDKFARMMVSKIGGSLESRFNKLRSQGQMKDRIDAGLEKLVDSLFCGGTGEDG